MGTHTHPFAGKVPSRLPTDYKPKHAAKEDVPETSSSDMPRRLGIVLDDRYKK